MAEILAKIECEEPQVSITSNLANVQEQLEVFLVDFEKKEYATLKEAKQARATLNKVYETLENERKRIHEIIERPYTNFLPQYEKATARLNECQKYIKEKCAEMENKEKEVLAKSKVTFTLEIDVEERAKIEKWLTKNSFVYKVK